MQTMTNRGLAGRARKAHYRSRASRLFSQQLIDDYFEPNSHDWNRDRYIPIRHRSDFLPSVASTSVADTTDAYTQLELPLTGDDDNGRQYEGGAPTFPSKGDTAPDGAIRFRPRATPACEDEQTTPGLTLRGFLFGCALGSSAAAVVLLILSVVL